MDTKNLLAEAKARFSHNSAKAYLKEKYESKLLVAEQGGLWRADAQTISLLETLCPTLVVLVDTFGNPIEVDRIGLLFKLRTVYDEVMREWHREWKVLESKR